MKSYHSHQESQSSPLLLTCKQEMRCPVTQPGQGSQWVWQNSTQLPLDATLNVTLRHPTVAHPKLSQALDFLAFLPDAESIAYTVIPTLSLSPCPWIGHTAPATARYYLSIPKCHPGARTHLLCNTTLALPCPLHFIPLLMLFHNSVGHPSSRTRSNAWRVRLRSMSRDLSLISKSCCFLSSTLTKSSNYLLLCSCESRITWHKDLPGICLVMSHSQG